MVEKTPELAKWFENEQIVFGNAPSLERERLPIGIKELDIMLDGGLYRKGFSIFAGAEGQGKTWTAQQLAKTSIAAGLQVCYVDMEKAYDPTWWKAVGVDVGKLWVAQANSGEEAVDMCKALLLEKVDVVIIDSLAAMVPMAESEATAEQATMAMQARMNSSFFRVVNSLNKTSHVFIIQQLREAVGIVYGNPNVIPGGRAMRHYSSTMVQCKRAGWIEETQGQKKVKRGFKLKYEVLKQRGTANTGDFVEVDVLFSGKIDEVGQMIGVGIALGIIEQKGAFYTIQDKNSGEILATIQGKAKLSETLEKDEALYNKFIELIP